MRSHRRRLHRIVIVGGGAGGLELATRLGDTLGKRGRARRHADRQERARMSGSRKLHEIAAGSMDIERARGRLPRAGALAPLPLPRRRDDRRSTASGARCTSRRYVDDEGDAGHAATRAFGYDTLVHRGRQPEQRLRHAGRRASTRCSSRSQADARALPSRASSTPASARTRRPTPLRPEQLHVAIIGAGATGVELAAELHRTTRELVAYGLDRIDPEKDIQVILIEAADRDPAGAAAAPVGGHRGAAARSSACRCTPRAQVAEVLPDGVRLADGRDPAGRAGRLGGRRQGARLPEGHRRARDQPHQPARRAADAADDARRRTSSRSATAPRARGPAKRRAAWCRRARRRRISRPRTWSKQIRSRLRRPAARRRSAIATSARSSRSASISTVGNLMGGLIGGSLMIEGCFARMMYLSLYKMHELRAARLLEGRARHAGAAHHAAHRAARQAALNAPQLIEHHDPNDPTLATDLIAGSDAASAVRHVAPASGTLEPGARPRSLHDGSSSAAAD